MVAAAMLAGIVVGIVKSEPVQASLRQVILCSVPFLYDENGEPSCKVGKYMAKEDPEPEPPAEEANLLQLVTKPDLENQPRPVKSDPPWYECALSWDCIKKKGGELKDHLLEKIRKEAVQHCGSDADCIRDYMEKRVGADIAGLLFPHLNSQSSKLGKFFGIDPWFEFSSFVMDHPTFSLGVVSTIIALFVSPPLGGTMLVSGAVSGGISWWEGNDLDTILRDAGIGGFAGVFGYGVFAGVSRYVGARLAQSTLSPFIQKWLPKIIGGGSGGGADQSAFDGLRDRKFDWRSATIAGMIGMLIPYAGAVIDGSPALGKQLQQMIPGVSGDGTLAMPWVKKNGQEAAEGYNKASGKSDGGTAKKEFKAGTPEHKAQRWKEYKEGGGTWSYEHWSKNYENNMQRAKKAQKTMDDYHKRIGWGEREVEVTIKGHTRVLDIADVDARRAIEHKTRTGKTSRSGYFSLTKEIKWEVERDAMLVKDNWDITWIFEDARASEPLLEALKEAGIKYKIIEKGGI
ncbi:hypothetical protein HMPREF9374_3664 [Desmospora sp. 8437]|nr:hypothetical protein HMPREF9374_3664 [Desmospora sp. 8437]